MLNKYSKKFSLTSFGGVDWIWLTGFEQVITNGVSTYYAIDDAPTYNAIDDAPKSRIVTFNHFWIYQDYQNLPYPYSWTTKYIGGYFYFSSENYFYKTYSNFTVINYYPSSIAAYRQIAFDPARSKFYVASQNFPRIDVFDTSCSLLQSINLGSKQPFGLVFFNGNIYAGVLNSNQVIVIQNGLVSKYFTVNQCPVREFQIVSITVDTFGYFALSCFNSNLIVVYDSNGNYMNTYIQTSAYPYISAIDADGRFVIVTSKSLDIYY